MNHPLVSVIIPFYNRVEVTLRALESTINQTYSNLEILLINDGSTLDIALIEKMVSSTPNCRMIHTTNGGPARARNLGIQQAKGEYIAFLDSDDYWVINKLEIQIQKMLDNNWSFTHTSYEAHDSDQNTKQIIYSGKKNYKSPWPAFHCLIATPTVVLQKDLVKKNSFNTDLRVGEDTLLWLELSRFTTLHGINHNLAVVNISNTTTAKNRKLKLNAFLNVNKYGFKNSFLIMSIHRVYILFRQIIRQ